MSLVLKEDHKQHLSFLCRQSLEVLQNFCKVALEYIDKGPNNKLYHSASQKLQEDSDQIKDAVESLVFLLVECCKNKVNEDVLIKTLCDMEFNNDQCSILCSLYNKTRDNITKIVTEKSMPVFPYFNDLRWRFEAVVGSRALLNQLTPIVTLNLETSNSPYSGSGEITNTLLQTDPRNLIRITESLEKALQLTHSSRSKKRHFK